jgi:hypothetical protein
MIRKRVAEHEPVIGMRMRVLFDLAKKGTDLPLPEVHTLLDQPAYEPRMAAFCILDFKARRRLEVAERAALAEVYLARHDRITTWDMVDRSAPRVLGLAHVVGAVGAGVLEELAASAEPLRQRSAIYACLSLLHDGDATDRRLADRIVTSLAEESHPYVKKAVATFTRYAEGR